MVEMDKNSNQKNRLIIFRLIRIEFIAFVLLLLTIVMNPKRFLPPDMSVGEFFQALLGVVMLAGVMAAVVFRAWNDYQRKKREKK